MKETVFAKAAAVVITAGLLFGIVSCEQLQSTLSSEQEEKVAEETGSASIAGPAWYYNGSSSTDMSSATGETLCISFGKAAVLSTGGLSGGFTVTYTDADGNASSKELSLTGGYFNNDGTEYYLYMTPVLSLINGSSAKDGTAAVLVKAGGFVCNEGTQKGRSFDTIRKTINIMPLFGTATLSGVSFSTKSSTNGASITIPVLGSVSLADDASFELTAASGSSLPTGITQSDFTLSVSGNGMSVLVTPSVELYGQEFKAVLTVSGILAPLSGKAYTQTIPVVFSGSMSSSDTLQLSSQSSVNRDISSVAVKQEGTNLIVNVNFDSVPYSWENDRIVIMIDDANLGSGTTAYASKQWMNAAANMSVNSSVDFYGYDTMKNSDADDSNNMTTEHTWTQDTSSSYGWAYYADSTTLSYTIPLANITDGTTSASASDTFRVAVFFSDYWNTGTTHVYDAVPASAATITADSETDDTLSVNFDKAIVYSSEAAAYPVPSAPVSFIVKSYTANTVTLAWSNSYSATGYKIYRSTDGVTWGTALAVDVTAAAYTDTAAAGSTTYYYKVSAVNASGEGSATSSISVTTAASASAPLISTASVSGVKVTLTWNAASGAVSYNVYRSTDNSVYTKIASAVADTTYTDSGDSSKTYYYKVAGINKYGEEGTLSEAKSAATEAVPGKTTSTVIIAPSSSDATWTATVTWTAVDNVNTYEVGYKPASGTTYTTTTGIANSILTKTITGLTAGSVYDFLVTAHNDAGSTSADVVVKSMYPVITLDGVLSSSEYWTDADVAGESSDSWDLGTYSSGAADYDISKIYVTNDASYLYVAVVSDNPFACWWKDNFVMMFDNTNTAGNSASSASGVYNAATYQTYSGIDYYICHKWAQGSLTDNAGTASTASDSASISWSGSLAVLQSVIEYKIPLADIGNAVTGNVIRVFAATTCVWDDSGTTIVSDMIPSAAGTTSTTTNANDTLNVDMTKALSCVIK
jgi:fibronectin type 3 domain-containing protein